LRLKLAARKLTVKNRPFCPKKTTSKPFIAFLSGLLAFVLAAGCAGSYGRFAFDENVTDAFKTYQVPPDLKFYYYGVNNRHYAIVGLDPKWELRSRIWRPIDPQTEEFKKAVRYIWEIEIRPPYYPRGSNIFDNEGNKVGVYYSSLYATVKFGPDNQIQVMPDSGFHEGFREERNH
jgi:hypothetical protein